MKLRIYLVITTLIWTSSIIAQEEFESQLLQKKEQGNLPKQHDKGGTLTISKRDQTGVNTYGAGSILQASSDKSVAYYQNVAKQWGWYVGIGPALTKEEASHLNVVYKFSNKSKAGHWMKIEAIDGYGEYTTDHILKTYIAPSNSNDSTVNANWKEKLASICQWELMPDGSGEVVVVERAYDDQKKLVYNYQPVFISDKEMIGAYTDSWGLPAKMSQRGGKPADVLVNIQLDQWGNDSIIKLVDTEGNIIMNSSGSWIVQNICDKEGNVLKNYALNQLGAHMNDNYGNCSYENEVDEYGNTLHSVYYDAGGNTVRLSKEFTFDDVYEEYYEYDCWHRMISKSFYYGNKADITSQGVHRIEYTYNNRGQQLSMVSRGLNNKPCGYEIRKAAYVFCRYDKKGHQISMLCLDPDSTYIKSDSYYYRMLKEYDGDNLKREEDYIYNGSDTILWHYESYSPQVNIYYHRDQEAYIDTIDVRGNILSRTYVSTDQNPITHLNRSPIDNNPFSRYASTYQYEPHSCTKVTTWYDKNGHWAQSDINNYRSPARTIITTDSLRHTITHTGYDKDSIMLAHYQEGYDKHFNVLLYKQSMTTAGEAGRSSMNDALYYKTKVEYTPTGQVLSIFFLNEFDEPAYGYSDNRYYCYKIYNGSDNPQYYDEDKNIIKKHSSPSATKAACIEITSESGKRNGLKDGDVFIRYGDWFYNHNQKSNYNFEDLYAQMVFSAAKDSIEIWVLRHFPKEKKSKIIKMHVKGGTVSEIGFKVHEIFYTNKETQRYLRTFMAFKSEEEQQVGKEVKPIKRQKRYDAYIIVPQFTNNSSNSHPLGWINPMLLISTKTKELSDLINLEDRVWLYNGKDENVLLHSGIILSSEDGIHLRRDSISEENFLLSRLTYLTEEEHYMASNLLNQARDKYPNDIISNMDEQLSDILKSQPSQSAIDAHEMIQTIENNDIGFIKNDASPNILKHLEGLDSTKIYKIYSLDAVKYGNLIYRLDKNHFTFQIAHKDSTSKNSIVFIHEIPEGVDEVLYLSKDSVVWAKGHLTHGSKDIIRKNLCGEEYDPLDKYNQEDLKTREMPEKSMYDMAVYLHNHHAYGKSLTLLKNLSKRKYGPAFTTLAKAYLVGAGVAVDTARSISLYEKALRYNDTVHGELGKLYYKTHQYKSAIPLLRKDISFESYKMLGLIYENGGNGVTLNTDSALYYYKQGCRLATEGGYFDIFSRFYDDVSRIRTQRIFTPSNFKELSEMDVQSKSVDSLFSKGENYYYDENYLKAYSYLKAAADSLYPEAEEYMAEYMENEKFGFNDKLKAQEYRQLAVKHFLKRAENGDSTAYSKIAHLYTTYNVEGHEADKEKAKYYYKQALQYNDFTVAKELGDMYKEEYNYAEALDAYLVGVKAGEKECMFPTAQLYELDYNIQEATKWYRECHQTSKNQEEREQAKKALQRFGVPLFYTLKDEDLMGVWVYKDLGTVKVFLRDGSFFALYYKDSNNIMKEILDCRFRPWMIGSYYVSGNTQYIEDVEMRDINNYLGEQHLTCQIDNNVMRASWDNKSNERWEKLPESNRIIQYVMQKWDSYKKYIQENLKFKRN